MSTKLSSTLYNTEVYPFTDSRFSYDVTDMLHSVKGPLEKQHKELLLACGLCGTMRNFQQPALQMLKVEGRTGILGALRDSYSTKNLLAVANYRVASGGANPTNEKDFDKLKLPYNFYFGWGFSGNIVHKVMDNYDNVMSVLDQVSVYEWLSCYLHVHPIGDLINNIKSSVDIINKSLGTVELVVNDPFTLSVIKHDDFLTKLVNMKERKIG